MPYEVQISPNGVDNWTLAHEGELVGGYVDIESLTPDTEYFFRVRLIEGVKESDWSEVKQKRTLQTP